MAVKTLKAEKVAAQAIGLLTREVVLPQLVWRDAAGDFAGAKNDTISMWLPAYVKARKRGLRSGDTRQKNGLFERKVDVTLDTDVYLDIPITDAEMTLDIRDFGRQVNAPVVRGIVEQLEQEVADRMTGATYARTVTHAAGVDDPHLTLVRVRAMLNQARVPMEGRICVAGSDFETECLSSPKLVDVSRSGSDSALRDAVIGRLAGFTVIVVPALPANFACVYHRTAFVMNQQAPVVPNGAPWGTTLSANGFAIRTVQIMDADTVTNRFIADAFCGTNEVNDNGHFTGAPAAGGAYEPVIDPDTPVSGQANAWANDLPRLVRAVKITVTH